MSKTICRICKKTMILVGKGDGMDKEVKTSYHVYRCEEHSLETVIYKVRGDEIVDCWAMVYSPTPNPKII